MEFKALNDASVLQTHHTKSPFAFASEVPRGIVKSVLDVWNAYHSVPIRAEDKDKLTFIMPWGRYRYLRAPQGTAGLSGLRRRVHPQGPAYLSGCQEQGYAG